MMTANASDWRAPQDMRRTLLTLGDTAPNTIAELFGDNVCLRVPHRKLLQELCHPLLNEARAAVLLLLLYFCDSHGLAVKLWLARHDACALFEDDRHHHSRLHGWIRLHRLSAESLWPLDEAHFQCGAAVLQLGLAKQVADAGDARRSCMLPAAANATHML